MSALHLFESFEVEEYLIPALINKDYYHLPLGAYKALNQWRSQLPEGVFEVVGNPRYTQGAISGLIGDCVTVNLWVAPQQKKEA